MKSRFNMQVESPSSIHEARYPFIKNKGEIFHLTTHSYFICGYNGIKHMFKDHKSSEISNPLSPFRGYSSGLIDKDIL